MGHGDLWVSIGVGVCGEAYSGLQWGKVSERRWRTLGRAVLSSSWYFFPFSPPLFALVPFVFFPPGIGFTKYFIDRKKNLDF